MKLIIDNYEINLIVANNFFQKLCGLTFKKKIDYALMLRCNGVHTFFMKANIDIVVCDKSNNILAIHRNVKKNKIILPKKHAYYTYELPANTIKKTPKKIELKL